MRADFEPAGGRADLRAVHRRRRLIALALVVAVVVLLATQVDVGKGVSFARFPREQAAEIAHMRAEQARIARERQAELDAQGRAAPAAQAAAVARFLKLGQPIYCGGGKKKFVALTFDDGPSQQSEQVFQLLRDANVRSTFFHIGEQVGDEASVTRDAATIGEVGEHTYDHANLTQLSAGDAKQELTKAKQAIEQAVGRPIRLWRAPYGAHTPAIDAMAAKLGLLHVLWDVDSQDGLSAGADTIQRNVIEGLRPGNIILMHEIHATTLAALPAILQAVKQRGLIPVTVPEMLALDPPSVEQVNAGYEGCQQLVTNDTAGDTAGSAPR